MEDRFERYQLRCRVLAPLHIGTGESITPLEMGPDGKGNFYRLKPESVLLHLDDATRQKWDQAIARADIKEARRILIQKAKIPAGGRGGDSLYPIAGFGEFTKAYTESVERGRGEYEILEMMRNADGSICIPGSSIKGAIRTAFLSEMILQILKTPERSPFPPNGPRSSEEMEGLALGCWQAGRDGRKGRFDIDLDPFRALRVEDASLPADSGRLVQARNRSLARNDQRMAGIPMQLEVAGAKALGMNPEPRFSAEISIDRFVNENLRERRRGSQGLLTSQKIHQACKDFFAKRMQEEIGRFYAPWGVKETLATAFALQPGEFYFRLGRFSHVECMTVESYRQVQRRPGLGGHGAAPRGQEWPRFGSARTVVDGKIPFGWLACKLEPAPGQPSQ